MVHDDVVAVVAGALTGYDVRTGARRWTRDPGVGLGAVVGAGDQLWLGRDGDLEAWSMTDGTVRWTRHGAEPATAAGSGCGPSGAVNRFPEAGLDHALDRLRSAIGKGDALRAADADLAYQSTIIAASGLPRVVREWDRLTWQVRASLTALEIGYEDKLARFLAEDEALHAAIARRDPAEAETLCA